MKNIIIAIFIWILGMAMIVGLNVSENALMTPMMTAFGVLAFTLVSIFSYFYSRIEGSDEL